MATSPTQLAKTGKFGDLNRRLVFLLLALVVYRIGAHIPVPGVNPQQLLRCIEPCHRADTAIGPLLNLINRQRLILHTKLFAFCRKNWPNKPESK